MINGVEELPHIALERIAWACVVSAHSTNHLRDLLHTFVRSFVVVPVVDVQTLGIEVADVDAVTVRVEILPVPICDTGT